MDENKENKNENNNDIEVIIGDSSELNFSEVEEFVEALKPKVQKKSNIIIPGSKKKNNKKKQENKD